MIPTIAFDFNFDWILVMLFGSYILYGYFSGGHKQIRFFINLVLPFMLIYYLGRYITNYLYIPLSDTLLFDLIDNLFGIMKYTVGMVIAYILTYILLFVGIFILSIYARRYILNENMRAKLGIKNNYLGALFSLINGYVLIYFIILPVFSLNLIGSEAHVTNFVLEHPPPFSRIARTAEKAVPIKGLADKAQAFEQLLSVDGIEGYYNEAIYAYQQLYMGNEESFEAQFMEDVYAELSSPSKLILIEAYSDFYGENLTASSFLGVSRVLVEETTDGKLVYEEILESENDFNTVYNENKDLVKDYETDLAEYEADSLFYEYYVEESAYTDELDDFIAANSTYLEDKIDAFLNEETFTEVFNLNRPTLDTDMPEGYEEVTTEPTSPIETQEILDALDFLDEHEDKVNVSDELEAFGVDFENHKGLLMWYVDELDRQMADTSSGDISDTIISFKSYYDTMIEEIDDPDLEDKLYLAKMSIDSYDVFTLWIACTVDHIDTIPLDDIELTSSRCGSIDPSTIETYDFANDAISLISTLFDGESVSWIIVQFKYDYEDGVFDELSESYPEVASVLESTKGLVDDYDLYYKDIANSIDGNVSMVVKIAISVMKYNFDAYELLEDTPLISAVANDFGRLCTGSTPSPINRDVLVCPMTEGEGAFKELFNMRYLSSEVVFKAYIMVDDNSEPKIYDSQTMTEFLDKVNDSVENNVFADEVIIMLGDQFAFNVIDETNNYTLLEQMYDDGQITIEAMRILADDDHELFSPEFRQRVRSLIR